MAFIEVLLLGRFVVSIRGKVHAVNVIIKIAVCKLVDLASNTYASAVDKNTQQRLPRDRLAFLMRGQ